MKNLKGFYTWFLSEIMKTNPPEGATIVITGDQRSITIMYKKSGVPKAYWPGRISFERWISVVGGQIWKVTEINSLKGYGPLLYDLAMEMVFKVGGVGLAPDTISVSDEAKAVWKKYYTERSDVQKRTLPRDVTSPTKPEYLRCYYSKNNTGLLNKLEAEGSLSFEL